MSDERRSDRLAIFGSALLFSTGGVAIKWIAFGPWQVAAVRAAVAAVAVWWLVPGPITMRRRAVVLTGMAQGGSMLLFVIANKLTTAANAIFLQAAAPLYIPLLATFVLGERATRRDVVAMAGIAAGLGMFFAGAEPATATAPNPRLGDIVAVTSGVTWACTVVGLRYLARELPARRVHASQEQVAEVSKVSASGELPAGASLQVPASEEQIAGASLREPVSEEAVADAWLQVSANAETIEADAKRASASSGSGAAKGALLWGNIFVVGIALPFAWPLPEAGGGDLALLVYLGIAQVALAYRLLVRAVARVPALEASLLALFEPVLNPLWAFLLLGETPSGWALAGAATLASVTIARAAAGSREPI